MLIPIRAVLLFVLLFGMLAVSGVTISRVAADEPRMKLTGQVIDAGTQQPVAARIHIQSADGRWFFPASASAEGSAIEYKRQAGLASVEQHVTLSAHPFVVTVTPGKYTSRSNGARSTLRSCRPWR